MTRTEAITRLCEIAAQLADLSQQYQGDPDVKFAISNLEQNFQKTMEEINKTDN